MKSGEWTTYGSGAWGGSMGAAGLPLALQKYKGTGPQAEKLNDAISDMEMTATQTGETDRLRRRSCS